MNVGVRCNAERLRARAVDAFQAQTKSWFVLPCLKGMIEFIDESVHPVGLVDRIQPIGVRAQFPCDPAVKQSERARRFSVPRPGNVLFHRTAF